MAAGSYTLILLNLGGIEIFAESSIIYTRPLEKCLCSFKTIYISTKLHLIMVKFSRLKSLFRYLGFNFPAKPRSILNIVNIHLRSILKFIWVSTLGL